MIAVYTPKGGVRKTTCTYTLAEALASKGQRVLMIDADSQCNLSSWALGPLLSDAGHDMDSFVDQCPKPCLLGEALKNARPGSELVPCYTVQIATFPRENPDECAGELRLLMGDDMLTSVQEMLATSLDLMLISANERQRDVPGAPYHLARLTAAKYQCDWVIWDLAPTDTKFNQMVVGCCDGLITPCLPDQPSARALDSLREKLATPYGWLSRVADTRQYQQLSTNYRMGNTLDPCRYLLRQPTPKFLGVVISERAPSNDRGRAMERVFAAAESLQKTLSEVPIGVFRGQVDRPHNGVISLVDLTEGVELMFVPYFNTMSEVSHALGVPAPFLKINEVDAFASTHPGVDVRDAETRLSRWRSTVNTACQQIMRMMGVVDQPMVWRGPMTVLPVGPHPTNSGKHQKI